MIAPSLIPAIQCSNLSMIVLSESITSQCSIIEHSSAGGIWVSTSTGEIDNWEIANVEVGRLFEIIWELARDWQSKNREISPWRLLAFDNRVPLASDWQNKNWEISLWRLLGFDNFEFDNREIGEWEVRDKLGRTDGMLIRFKRLHCNESIERLPRRRTVRCNVVSGRSTPGGEGAAGSKQ